MIFIKNGYYLSTYLEIDKVANVVGISSRHDFNISLWEKKDDDIELIHYWELERITGIKHNRVALYSKEQAMDIISSLIEQYHLKIEDINEIWGTPEIDTCSDYYNESDLLSGHTYHSLSHLFSSLLSDSSLFYSGKMIGLALDGGPDDGVDKGAYGKKFYSGAYVDHGKVHLFHVPSPGYMWILATEYFHLREGTLMALATASTSELAFDTGRPLLIYDKEDAKRFNDQFIAFVKKVEALQASDAGVLFNGFDCRFSEKENKISMVMKEIQRLSIETVDSVLDMLIEQYKIDVYNTTLAMSGGYALNCPTNSHVMQKYGFKEFIAPPCVSDTGISLGIALYAFYNKMNKLNFRLGSAFWGDKDVKPDRLSSPVYPYKDYIRSVSTLQAEQCVADLTAYPIVWVNGRAEIGPRALGNRSIIGDPTNVETKNILNRIKQRQWWRPVAPIILEEELDNWFENSYPSPFMLHTFKIRNDKADQVPSILHLDNSARVQTIMRSENPLLYDLISFFKSRTGVPIICNTSLNDVGEPIINTLEEAINFALRKKIPIVYYNGCRLELKNHELYQLDRPLQRPIKLMMESSDPKISQELMKYNPYNVPDEILKLYFTIYELHNNYDLTNINDVKRLKVHGRMWKSRFF